MSNPLYEPCAHLNIPISRQEVIVVMDKAKRGKEIGVDGLPDEVLKVDPVVESLQSLFQLCSDNGKVPTEWCKAIVTPIPNSADGDKRVPLSYRGISLLSNVVKL